MPADEQVYGHRRPSPEKCLYREGADDDEGAGHAVRGGSISFHANARSQARVKLQRASRRRATRALMVSAYLP
eukprot:10355519-Heterocapsa_arctica.AAC.1